MRGYIEDFERRRIPVALKLRRIHSFLLFYIGHHNVYAVVRPFALLTVGPDVNKKTIDVLADVLSCRFRPKQAGTKHTIFIFGPDGSVLRCLDVKDDSEKNVTNEWANQGPQFSHTIADDDGYVSCLRCSATGFIGGVLRKRRQCPKCLGRARHVKKVIER
jgi:hypothetical protein